ncbi:MAG: hypothetical protein IVW53_14655 [Chloroflexi bacterium]|nr:hypothetical protein [Chloroflexota bacterium]
MTRRESARRANEALRANMKRRKPGDTRKTPGEAAATKAPTSGKEKNAKGGTKN